MKPTELKAMKRRVCSKRYRDKDVLDRRPASSSDNHRLYTNIKSCKPVIVVHPHFFRKLYNA